MKTPIEVEVNGIKITLTDEQLQQIREQTEKAKPVQERYNTEALLYAQLNQTDQVTVDDYKGGSPMQKSIRAAILLHKAAELYNEGTMLDWKNTDQYKWLPYKYFSSGGGVSVRGWIYYGCRSPAGLFYKNKPLAEASLSNFRSLWDDYWMLPF